MRPIGKGNVMIKLFCKFKMGRLIQFRLHSYNYSKIYLFWWKSTVEVSPNKIFWPKSKYEMQLLFSCFLWVRFSSYPHWVCRICWIRPPLPLLSMALDKLTRLPIHWQASCHQLSFLFNRKYSCHQSFIFLICKLHIREGCK